MNSNDKTYFICIYICFCLSFFHISEKGTRLDARRRMHKLLITMHLGSKVFVIDERSEIASSSPSLPESPPIST